MLQDTLVKEQGLLIVCPSKYNLFKDTYSRKTCSLLTSEQIKCAKKLVKEEQLKERRIDRVQPALKACVGKFVLISAKAKLFNVVCIILTLLQVYLCTECMSQLFKYSVLQSSDVFLSGLYKQPCDPTNKQPNIGHLVVSCNQMDNHGSMEQTIKALRFSRPLSFRNTLTWSSATSYCVTHEKGPFEVL